jgi:hypothetical protein
MTISLAFPASNSQRQQSEGGNSPLRFAGRMVSPAPNAWASTTLTYTDKEIALSLSVGVEQGQQVQADLGAAAAKATLGPLARARAEPPRIRSAARRRSCGFAAAFP